MPKISVKTKGNASPRGKRRVYFTCHPEDFSRHFEKICEDIFKTHDVAIYYTEDMTARFEEKDLEVDLGSNNLFVVPVTFRLLTQPSRAMEQDIAYAKQAHIPILPFMMEPGIDDFYAKPEKFGKRQYLNPYSQDLTEISYEDKLKKCLGSILVSDEMVKRIQAAFDAYIFLSYRKKDRRYANELMRLIHNHPEYRDVAIWYDEFLTPGESFQTNIENMLQRSELFALLVTPNLLEEPDGKRNFVMETEYPMARQSEKPILPAEMEATDKAQLAAKYADIPSCIDPHDDDALLAGMVHILDRIAKDENNNDPEHNFLIGLAYLDGTDVEVNRERGLALITSAAEAGLREAVEKLAVYYRETYQFSDSRLWFEKLYGMKCRELGESHLDTLDTLYELALACMVLQEFSAVDQLAQKGYALLREHYGVENPRADHFWSLQTLVQAKPAFDSKGHILMPTNQNYFQNSVQRIIWESNDLRQLNKQQYLELTMHAEVCCEEGKFEEAMELLKQLHTAQREALGEKHPDTIQTLGHLAFTHSRAGQYEIALQLLNRVYTLELEVLGGSHRHTLSALEMMADCYRSWGKHEQAAQEYERVYELLCAFYGEEDEDALRIMGEIASFYGDSGNPEKAIEVQERLYAAQCGKLGENSLTALTTLKFLAFYYSNAGQHEKSLELREKLVQQGRALLKLQPKIVCSYFDILAEGYTKLGVYQKAAEVYEEVLSLRCQKLEEEQASHSAFLEDATSSLRKMGRDGRAKEVTDSMSASLKEELDGWYQAILRTLWKLADTYEQLGYHRKEAEVREQLYALRCEVQGEMHPDALTSLHNLAYAYGELGDYSKALTLYEKAYTQRCGVLGEKHPNTLMTLNNLAYAYSRLGNHQKAAEFREKVYALRCEALGEKHPNTLRALADLAKTYDRMGDHQKEVNCREKLYALRAEILGETHPDTRTALHNIAVTYDQLGEYQKALSLWEKLYSLRCEVLGNKHRDTLRALWNCMLCHRALGNEAEAQRLEAICHQWEQET